MSWRTVPFRSLMVVLAVAVVCCATPAACVVTPKEAASPLQAQEQERGFEQQGPELSLATGEISGAYNRVGSTLASLWSNHDGGIRVKTRSTGGSVANLTMLAKGEVDLALAASNSAYRAYSGSFPFTEPVKKLRAIAALYPEVFHFLARRDSGLEYISDIRGLRVAMGSRLGGTHLTAWEVFRAHGIGPDDVRPEYLAFSEAIFAMQAGMVDVAVIGAGIPAPAVEDAATIMEVKLLGVRPEMVRGFLGEQPYVSLYKIPLGTYRGVDREVLTIVSPALLVTTAATPDDLVYRLTKALFSNREVVAANPYIKAIEPATAVKGVSIPFHNGALQYYREAGVLK